MINRLLVLFAPPHFADEEKSRVAVLLNTILFSLVGLLVVVNLLLIVVQYAVAKVKQHDVIIYRRGGVFFLSIPHSVLEFIARGGNEEHTN